MKNMFLMCAPVVLIFFLSCTPISNKSQKVNEHHYPSDELNQDNTKGDIIIEMLKEFYSAHTAIMISKLPEREKTDSAEFVSLALFLKNERIRKSDSLNTIYCTKELREQSKEYLKSDYGHDILTDNRVSVLLNENILVEKNTAGENSYIVSFLATQIGLSGYVKQQVNLNVQVIKEGETYKIYSVKDYGSYWIKEDD